MANHTNAKFCKAKVFIPKTERQLYGYHEPSKPNTISLFPVLLGFFVHIPVAATPTIQLVFHYGLKS